MVEIKALRQAASGVPTFTNSDAEIAPHTRPRNLGPRLPPRPSYNPQKPRWFEPGSRFHYDWNECTSTYHVSNFAIKFIGRVPIGSRSVFEASRLLRMQLRREQRAIHPNTTQSLLDLPQPWWQCCSDVANWAESSDLRNLSVVTMATPFLELFHLLAIFLIWNACGCSQDASSLSMYPFRSKYDVWQGSILLAPLVSRAWLFGWRDLRIFKRRRRGQLLLSIFSAHSRHTADLWMPKYRFSLFEV